MVTVSRADLLRLAQIVREETGNQVAEKNFPMIESRVRTRLMRLGLESMAEYWRFFASHEAAERDALQGLLTTHYTFFFREFSHFEILEEWLAREHERLKARYQAQGTPVRVWSAACSRGQEAYSLAMFLSRKTDIPFEIVGTDIDAESVAYARNGVYPLKEVNTIPHVFVADHWRMGRGAVREFAAVTPGLKNKVSFDTLNLLDVRTWAGPLEFDVIFCRNVFIYFEEEKMRAIALSLVDRLVDNGLFVSGMSEPLRFEAWTLEPVGPSAYVKAGARPPVSAAARPQTYVQPRAGTACGIRVLCVDDSPTIQRLLQEIFARDPAFAPVEAAGNGREARALLDRMKFDLVTLDIHMPVVNGVEFMEKLYKGKTDPPVLMISSVNRADIDLATRSLALGAFDYVEKPAMNHLEKSANEILTKAKMALRSRAAGQEEIGAFDQSIARHIVVPDASQCARLVLAGSSCAEKVEHIVKGQGGEYRSPALVIDCGGARDLAATLEGKLLEWTSRKVVRLRREEMLKPNHVYLTDDESPGLFAKSSIRSVSLQILDARRADIASLKSGASSLQVLLDESLAGRRSEIERTLGVKVSDITPATSFASLSLEFFADLRRAA